jgi:hypothetical protein
MTGKYISFDAEILEQVAALQTFAAEHYPAIFNLSVQSLEGGLDRERVAALAEVANAEAPLLLKIVQAAGILFWEVTKGSPPKDDLVSVVHSLRSSGWPEGLAKAFTDSFKEHRIRLSRLRGALAISKRRYKDFVWRLDVELARRNVSVVTQPKYMLRLDVFEPREGSSGKGDEQSLHLQADYANLKHMQSELQRAMDDLASKHGQRITTYIK